MGIASVAPHRSASQSPLATTQPANPAVGVRSMLRTVERVLLRDGGHRGALVNARAAVLEGEQRAALRADAWACMERLAGPVE